MSDIFRTDKNPWPMKLEISFGNGGMDMANICAHSFNSRLDLIFPNDKESVNETILDSFKSSAYYNAMIPLVKFLDKTFINSFVQSGKVLAISSNSRLDHDVCVALLENGILLLRVPKALHEKLGLHGAPSKSDPSRKIIRIDLMDITHKKKIYERVLWSFTHVLTFPCNLYLLATDEAAQHLGLTKQRATNMKYYSIDHISIPCANFLANVSSIYTNESSQKISRKYSDLSPELEENLRDLFEWIGLTTCKTNKFIQVPLDPFISTYALPSNFSEECSLSVFEYVGLIGTEKIRELIALAKTRIKELALPYFIMVVWGLPDALVNWKEEEHVYFNYGDNHFVIMVDSNDFFLSYKAISIDSK